jgi:hypothetical protein
MMPKADFLEKVASPVQAYDEGLEFFRGRGMLNETLRRLARELEQHGIAYSVIGAVALNQHGYRRFTEDIALLLSTEGLDRFQSEMVGRGYRPAFPGATKRFRATEANVLIEIVTTGEYPGDGKPKPVRFHEPGEHGVLIEGIRTVTLEKLIELKLASGMSAPDRLRDLADVQELVRLKNLDAAFAERLDPSVRKKFLELHRGIAQAREQGSKEPDG